MRFKLSRITLTIIYTQACPVINDFHPPAKYFQALWYHQGHIVSLKVRPSSKTFRQQGQLQAFHLLLRFVCTVLYVSWWASTMSSCFTYAWIEDIHSNSVLDTQLRKWSRHLMKSRLAWVVCSPGKSLHLIGYRYCLDNFNEVTLITLFSIWSDILAIRTRLSPAPFSFKILAVRFTDMDAPTTLTRSIRSKSVVSAGTVCCILAQATMPCNCATWFSLSFVISSRICLTSISLVTSHSRLESVVPDGCAGFNRISNDREKRRGRWSLVCRKDQRADNGVDCRRRHCDTLVEKPTLDWLTAKVGVLI